MRTTSKREAPGWLRIREDDHYRAGSFESRDMWIFPLWSGVGRLRCVTLFLCHVFFLEYRRVLVSV